MLRGGGHFSGAVVSKFTPPALQFLLLVYVGRSETVHDVGLLALGSAAAFFAGIVGDIGFQTSLSLPRAYYDVEDPPLVATRRLRYFAAACGSLFYLALVAGGLGRSDAHLWLLGPLPFLLAVSLGLSGAMNAVGKLQIEGRIAVTESIASVGLALAIGGVAHDALSGAFAGLTAGRAVGLALRLVTVARLPQSLVPSVGSLARRQRGFVVSNAALIFQGQGDLVTLGMLGSVAWAAAYAPLLRLAFTAALLGEALAWAIFFREREARGRALYPDSRLGRHLIVTAFGLGAVLSLCFAAVSPSVVHLISPDITVSATAVGLVALVIPVRFAALAISLEIVRLGMQIRQVRPLVLSSAVLVAGTVVAAALGSVQEVASARLASEVVLCVAFAVVVPRVRTVPC
jgi:O-antigen/teichoic acid export membrane protein